MLLGLKISKTPGSALHMAEKFVAHMNTTTLGVSKFRDMQLQAIRAREQSSAQADNGEDEENEVDNNEGQYDEVP